jgi:hypothetical protein
VTTPLTFTRERRCSLIDDLWILGNFSPESAPTYVPPGETAAANQLRR